MSHIPPVIFSFLALLHLTEGASQCLQLNEVTHAFSKQQVAKEYYADAFTQQTIT